MIHLNLNFLKGVRAQVEEMVGEGEEDSLD